MEKELVRITGSVEAVIFENKDSGFAVLDLNIGEELVNVVGEIPEVQEGEELELMGYYSTHPTYGYQFKAEICHRSLPATSHAVCKYLASGVVKGIGPVLAKRIVTAFEDQTLRVIEETPERLVEVKGITEKKCKLLQEEFKQVFGVRSLMLFLSNYQVTPAQSVQVWKKWGVLGIEIIKQNPYILCGMEFQIGFQTADKIAMQYEFEKDCYPRILAGIGYILQHNLNNGHTCLPGNKLLALAQKMLDLDTTKIGETLEEILKQQDLVCVERNKRFFALPEIFAAEQYICARIVLLLSVPQDSETDIDFVIRQIEEENNIQYEALQKKAIRQTLLHDIFILTGGPGTGKTTTLNAIIDVLEYQGKDIAIAAPTGRAAKRISEVTGREAKTIHRLLESEFAQGSLKFSRNEQEPLEQDVIVIDEMSMVDTLLFAALLRAAKPECKLVLVGDYNQLPSVGAGNVLHDLLASDSIPTVRLEHVFRQAAQSLIVTNAHSIVHGELPDLGKKDGDFFFMSRTNPDKAIQTVLDLVCSRLPKSYGYMPVQDIQVLCPSRKGGLGVVELNKQLQQNLNPESPGRVQFKSVIYTFREGDKVMQTRNNYDIEWTREDEKGAGIFNGDIGIIQMIDRGSQTLAIDFEGRVAFYSFELATELELAYAITVHKSQGSEFEAVVIPILGGYDKLYYRNLLYTAITRAKKILVIVGSMERVVFMVQNNRKSIRFTNLRFLLNQSIEA